MLEKCGHLSFYWYQNILGWSKLFVAEQKLIIKKNPHSGSRLGLPLTPQPTRLPGAYLGF